MKYIWIYRKIFVFFVKNNKIIPEIVFVIVLVKQLIAIVSLCSIIRINSGQIVFLLTYALRIWIFLSLSNEGNSIVEDDIEDEISLSWLFSSSESSVSEFDSSSSLLSRKLILK
jgi:hypothetical protein